MHAPTVAAKLNFVAPDRPELLYAIKECMRAMAMPTVEDEGRLKRILRYLKGAPRGRRGALAGAPLAREELLACDQASL